MKSSNDNIAWLGFWIFASVYVGCEAWLYSQGHETFFWQHKTVAEQQLQQKSVECSK